MNATNESARDTAQPQTANWKSIVAKYQKPSAARASWQIVNTLVPYALLWFLTVQEYLESSREKRFAYRLARNPIVLFCLAALGQPAPADENGPP